MGGAESFRAACMLLPVLQSVQERPQVSLLGL